MLSLETSCEMERSSSYHSESSSLLFRSDDGASQMGKQFAEFVALKAYASVHAPPATTHAQKSRRAIRRRGNSSLGPPSPIKGVGAFKPAFFMEPKYNPAISNTHICYEYDAHFKDAEKDWSRSGKKFSDEPRLGMPPSSDQGPTKREELPQYCEKEQPIFGKTRQLRPFFRAQQYTRPVDRCTIPYRPTHDDETSHLGPGAYVMPDPWRAKTGHGNIYGTHPLLSNAAKGRGDFDAVLPPKQSLSHLQLTGSVEVRSKSPKAALRNQQSAPALLGVTIARPSTTNAPVRQLSMVSTPCMTESVAFASESAADWGFDRSNTTTTTPTSKYKGFSFGKATFSTSSIDINTGTTNADVLYRRIKLKDGSSRIYALSKAVNYGGQKSDMPAGAIEAPSWGTEPLQVDETLAVVSGLVSPVGAKTYCGFSLDPPPPSLLACPPVTFANVTQASIDDSRATSIPGSSSGPVTSNPPNFRPPTVLKETRTAPTLSPQKSTTSKFSVRAAEIMGLGGELKFAPTPKRRAKGDPLGAKSRSSSFELDWSLVDSIESKFHP